MDLGYTMQTPEGDRFLMLGGRSAEEVVFGKVSSGASDDIQRATDLAERAVTQYGMAQKLLAEDVLEEDLKAPSATL